MVSCTTAPCFRHPAPRTCLNPSPPPLLPHTPRTCTRSDCRFIHSSKKSSWLHACIACGRVQSFQVTGDIGAPASQF
jgi:hypothetical protein